MPETELQDSVVLRWSPDSDRDTMTEAIEETTIRSVGSTPDILKSPPTVVGRVPGSITSDKKRIQTTTKEKR